MQVLDPRNPTIYEFFEVDVNKYRILYDEDGKKYTRLANTDYANLIGSPRYSGEIKLIESLYKDSEEGDYKDYDYLSVTPFMSIAVGASFYDKIWEEEINKNTSEVGVKVVLTRWNSRQVGYADEILGRVRER